MGRIAWRYDGLVGPCMVVLELHGVVAWVFCAAFISYGEFSDMYRQSPVKSPDIKTLFCKCLSWT